MMYCSCRHLAVCAIMTLGVWQGCHAQAAELDQATRVTIEKHLAWADTECRRAIAPSLKPIADLFAEAKRNTPALAAELLGFSSKWHFALDRMPFDDGGRHTRFVQAALAKHFFTPERLRLTIQQAVRDYQRRVVDVENQMLIRLRIDMADLPSGAVAGSVTTATLGKALDQAQAAIRRKVANDLRRDIGAVVASEAAQRVASRVLRSAAVRLGVSGGLIGTGVSSSWGTFGTSLAAGVAMDWVVVEVWDWWADPLGGLAAVLRDELDRIRALLIHGKEGRKGLHDVLTGTATQRATLRRTAMLKAIREMEK